MSWTSARSPAPGGGEVMFEGTVEGLRESDTITGRHLDDRARLKETVRELGDKLEIRGANMNNLKDVDVDIPLGVLVVLTGVAGSGKSSLIRGSVEGREGVVTVDQGAIRGSRRSNPATYTGLLDPIRKAFAKANGVKPALFSANSEGACPNCNGAGVIYMDLGIMAGTPTVCEECEGKRFDASVLEYTFGGKDISQVLAMSVGEAEAFFAEGDAKVPAAHKILERLAAVGLGYLTIGQPLTTLSGGERQRLKLATHMGDKGGIYVLDEPTTGLHLADVEQLLALLDRLVDDGKSVIVIEHHQAVMAHADWIIDLGPGPGNDGGKIVFEGTPADLIAGALHAHRGAPRRLRRLLGGEEPARLVEPQLVPAAVLLGGALDVGDPLAPLRRVLAEVGVAPGDPLALERERLVDEPLGLQLGLVGVALVRALVPDAHPHLEEADGVGVAVVEVLDAGLHERGHDRQLGRQAGLLGLLGEPLRQRLLAGVVARVGGGGVGEVDRDLPDALGRRRGRGSRGGRGGGGRVDDRRGGGRRRSGGIDRRRGGRRRRGGSGLGRALDLRGVDGPQEHLRAGELGLLARLLGLDGLEELGVGAAHLGRVARDRGLGLGDVGRVDGGRRPVPPPPGRHRRAAAAAGPAATGAPASKRRPPANCCA